jgi:ankyrin repeat protein
MLACRIKDIRFAAFFVEKLKVNVCACDKRHRDALYYATEARNVEVVKDILLPRLNLVTDDVDCKSVLMVCVSNNDLEMAEVFLQSRFSRSLIQRKDKYGMNVIHYCAVHGHDVMMALLLSFGAIVDEQDEQGATPLQYACSKGHVKVVSLLLRKSAAIDRLDNRGRNALHYCFHSEPSPRCVKLLTIYGIDINRHDGAGITPLMLACQTCFNTNIALIRYLLCSGADPILQDFEGKDSFDHCPFDSAYVKALMSERAGLFYHYYLILYLQTRLIIILS